MAAAPAAAAVWADVMWCLGLGCLLWAVRDGAELLVGRGPVRCFVLDLLAFTAGALAWQKAIVPPLHVLTEWIVRLLLAPARWGRRYIAVPLRKAACARLAALKKRCCPRRPRKKAGKSKKSGKNQLQKKSKILYN